MVLSGYSRSAQQAIEMHSRVNWNLKGVKREAQEERALNRNKSGSDYAVEIQVEMGPRVQLLIRFARRQASAEVQLRKSKVSK